MSFKVETPNGNPFDATMNQAKSWFFTGIVCGLFVALGIAQIASWDGWKSDSAAGPSGSARPAVREEVGSRDAPSGRVRSK